MPTFVTDCSPLLVVNIYFYFMAFNAYILRHDNIVVQGDDKHKSVKKSVLLDKPKKTQSLSGVFFLSGEKGHRCNEVLENNEGELIALIRKIMGDIRFSI